MAKKRLFVGSVSAAGLEPATNGLKERRGIFALCDRCPGVLGESLGGENPRTLELFYPLSQQFESSGFVNLQGHWLLPFGR